ncbi:MAG: cardiolipin synthase [Roseburia sp.]|nr:cardiolipin synthase [Roseburia sp.]MCM1097569.1 cardiolipin synthase [Ruminococcus flavefaciens]
MSTPDKSKSKLGNIKSIIYGRTAAILLGFIVQLSLLAVGYVLLRSYSFLFYGFFLLISVVTILYIFNTRGNPDMKLSWMFFIALFPVFGAILYMTIAMQPGTKVMYGRLQSLAKRTKDAVRPNREVWEQLREESPHMGQMAHYLYHRDNSPVYVNTQAVYYPLGDLQLQDMLKELRKAEKFIFMEFFIVSEGEMWDAVHEILKEKAAQGVEVRFMYDGTDVLFNLPNYYPKVLEEEGIRCKMFAPIKPIFSPHYNNRDHRKILVVDGRVAFTGGINLADEYINRKVRFGHWKDTGILVRGDAVERFTYMFLEMWNESERGTEDFTRYANPADASVATDGYAIPYSVCPLGPERVGEQVYLDIIHTAHTYVHIMTPYLILDYQMIVALVYAARRGVEVVIIMPHIPDKKYAFYLAKTYYRQLLEAGVRICEYEPGFVHAKVMVSDDCKAVVGTVNLDYRSLYHHFECGLILYQNSQVAQIEKDVQETLRKCLEQTPEDVKKRKLREKAIGWVMRIVAPLM